MSDPIFIVLTGGPGGGKTTLINELAGDLVWAGCFIALPEAISLMGGVGLSPREKRFQSEMVRVQMAQEDNLSCELGSENQGMILCNRGSLDPLAYWLDCGWPEDEFLECTGTTREEHYRRYAIIIHLVTAADGAEQAYRRWPENPRPEMPETAIRIDRLLQQVWSGHPNYFRIGNQGRDWAAKSGEARRILERFL